MGFNSGFKGLSPMKGNQNSPINLQPGKECRTVFSLKTWPLYCREKPPPRGMLDASHSDFGQFAIEASIVHMFKSFMFKKRNDALSA